jgi:hypothetical protein
MSDEINEEIIKKLLTHTESLINQIYWFKDDFNFQPSKEHIGAAINYTDIHERKDDFLKEVVYTVASWVYSNAKSKKIIDERLTKVNGDHGNASSFLTTQAFSKFRPGHPQGQFGELLLFNFIQYFFGAVPLLRKQRITTSVGHERFGADAIHFKLEDKKNILILGESKCYRSEYQFNTAFRTSLESIANSFNNFDKEIDLYTYDDFIEPELENIAKLYKANKLANVHFELVCLIAYNENNTINGADEIEIKKSIVSIIQERCSGLNKDYFTSSDSKIIDRMNYIIFPIWHLDGLLDEFKALVGTE